MRKEDILRLALRSLQLLEEGFPGHLEQLEKPKARIEGFPVTSSMKAFNTLAVYANLANMDFLVSKLQGQGVQVSGTIRTMEQYENRLLNTFEQRREAILAEIERGLRELLDQFESAIRLIDPIAKRFPYDTDHEFESDVFVTRELVEFAAMAAAKLNHRYDFQSYLERFMSRDETLRDRKSVV